MNIRFLAGPILLLVAPIVCSASNPKSSPIATVTRLYRDYAWEAVIDEPAFSDSDVLDQPRKILLEYFDPKLADLILEDRACEVKSGLICHLDFSPIWDSQDPTGTVVDIHRSSNSLLVIVDIQYPGDDKSKTLTYRLSKTDQGWRISDISAADWSLLSLLQSK